MNVAVLYDVDGWAQWSHAEGLRKFAQPWCSVSTFSLTDDFSPGHFDAVYTINLASSRHGQVSCVASHAWMHEAYDGDDWRTRGVNRNRKDRIGRNLVSRLKRVICRNKALGAWASRYNANVAVIPAGVDLSVFHPPESRPRRRLHIGWCGQVDESNPDGQFKGYREILCPLMDRVGGRYDFDVNKNTAKTQRTQSEMSEWFRGLDVFLSTACAEGTPNPPFQAAACGAAVIGTDVGQIADWTALRGLNLIVPTYRNSHEAAVTVGAIAAKLHELEDSQCRAHLADACSASIERDYNYKTLAPKTLAFICGVKP